MEKPTEDAYCRGYLAGYRDGIRAGASGAHLPGTAVDLIHLPIDAMDLSTRAYHCLTRSGCTQIADVIALNKYAISTMRNLGPKTASEIAQWLDSHGFRYSAWSEYLETPD